MNSCSEFTILGYLNYKGSIVDMLWESDIVLEGEESEIEFKEDPNVT